MSDEATGPEEEEANIEQALEPGGPWQRKSKLRVSVEPKDFRVEITTRRNGTLPTVPAHTTMMFTVTGSLGVEIDREEEGHGVEFHPQKADDGKTDWSDVLAKAMAPLAQILAASGNRVSMERVAPFPGLERVPLDPFASGVPTADVIMFGERASEVAALRSEVARRGERNPIPPDVFASHLASHLASMAPEGAGHAQLEPEAYGMFRDERWADLVAAILPYASDAYRQRIADALASFGAKETST